LLLNPWGKYLILAIALAMTLSVGAFTYYYVKYARMIEEKLKAGPFANTSLLYAAPQPVMLGDESRPEEIASYLRRCGYSEASTDRQGWYRIRPDAIEITPGPEAYDQEGAVIKIEHGRVTGIISLRDHTERTQYLLEPELITNLFDHKREKRRIVHYGDIPKVMVEAILSAEDKHFFQHSGFDPIGIVRAAWKDVTEHRLEGASTITQQLARTLWLGTERGWRRKVPETLITLHLEQELTKQQIFEDYANAIYLGHQGSFSIQGFGQAAEVYLGKDLNHVTLADAAFLAGLVQNPGLRNPFRNPERAKARRNVVLRAMRENGYITEAELESALTSPLQVTREEVESSDAPYFVDLVNETLQNRFQDYDFQSKSYRVYTTLDMNLQRDAVDAIRKGIVETDTRWKRRAKMYGTPQMPEAQVALVALDAQTGELKALVGGRSYGVSQLDHAQAKRQPGSSFKPFVYATALATAINGGNGPILTPATTVVDEPTTFMFDEKPYEPANFENEYFGTVTLRQALAHSLNVSAVKVAEMVGYDKVAETARAVGLNIDIKPTPSIALGAYEVTPLEIAGAYTVFVNSGDLLKPTFIKTIRDQHNAQLFTETVVRKPAIDPRVAYLVVNLMEEVLRSGTAAGVHARGFNLPAAGKTGTSDHDGWFAGFTSKLICVVWMGFDDNRDFKLQGADSALPIWTEFMKHAHQHREYRGVHEFEAPDGVVTADIDADTGQLATALCPNVRSEVFIAGTQPVEVCRLHGGGRTQIAGWEPSAPADKQQTLEAAAVPAPVANAPRRAARSIPVTPSQAPAPENKEKKGFFGRLRDLFR